MRLKADSSAGARGRALMRIGRFLAFVLAALFAFEVGSNYLYWLETKTLFVTMKHETAAEDTAPAAVTKFHPYVGFLNVYSNNELASRGYGDNRDYIYQYKRYVEQFIRPGCCEFPMKPEDNKDFYIVVLLGNSIVHSIGDYLQVYAVSDPTQKIQERLQGIPAAKGRKVVVLNLAIPGHKMPQELMELTYLMAKGTKVDLVVYYPSPLEITGALANEQAGLSGDFPILNVWLADARSLEQVDRADPAFLLGFYGQRSAQRTRQRMSECQLASCLIVNRTVLKIQDFLRDRFLTGAWKTDPNAAEHFANVAAAHRPATDDGRMAPYIERWKAAARMLRGVALAGGAQYVQVLLPHPSSVPRMHIRDFPQHVAEFADYRLAMTKLRVADEELGAEGMTVVDISHILDDKAPTDTDFFIDLGGHFGMKGLKMMVDRTIDIIHQVR